MIARNLARAVAGVALTWAALGCGGGDNSTGPEELEFPEISSEVRTIYCVRGNVTVGDSESSTITDDDCDADDSYFETYIVKVASTTSVTFEVESGFDSYLFLGRLESISGLDVDVTELAEDDDSGDGTDARLTFTLQPDTDYVIAVSGYDYFEVGPYTLSIR